MNRELLFIIPFQIILTLILLRISGEIGKHSLSMGYSSMTRIYQNGKLSFNLFYRVLYLPTALSIIAILIYILKLDFLIRNIWLVAIWYFLLQLALSLRKLPYTKLGLYFGSTFASILLTYIFYVYGISQGLVGLLPDHANFRTELWFIVVLFFYGLFNAYQLEDNYEDRRRKLEDRYLQFKKRYLHLLKPEFQKVKVLNDLLFSIMIYEDMNRPSWFRLIEKFLFKIGLSNTTGIMQIKSQRLMDDEQSINEAQQIILGAYKNYENTNEYEFVGKIITTYNPDAYYREEVRSIFIDIRNISSFLEEGGFQKTETNFSNENIFDVKEIRRQAESLISQIDELEKNDLETNMPNKKLAK